MANYTSTHDPAIIGPTLDEIQSITGDVIHFGKSIASENLKVVGQGAHGLVVLQPVRYEGGSLVAANTSATSKDAQLVVVKVIDANNVVVATGGVHTVASHGLTQDNYYYLANSGGNNLTITEPTTGLVQPILYVIDADTVLVNIRQMIDLG